MILTINKLRSSIVGLGIFFGLFNGCSTEPVNIKSGVFVDSPVEGIMYQAGPIEGRTDQDGTYYYIEGESITFSIEGLVIGESSLAKEIMTPIDLVSDPDSFVTHPKVTNITRFLQSLDEDKNPDNGITLSTTTREAVKSAFTSIDFSEANFDSQVDSFFGADLIGATEAQAHFFSTLASQKILPVDLIFLGDGFTNGTQSASVKLHDSTDSKDANVHKDTQAHGYAQLLANQIGPTVFSDFEWNNPLLNMDLNRLKYRELVEGQVPLPYNLGVHGATAGSLINEKSGSNQILKEVTKPIPDDPTQLEAAQFVALQAGHENRMKLFMLWIGIEDVLGALTAEGGGALKESNLEGPDIETFLEVHNLESVTADFDFIVDGITTIPHSYVFLATIPDITRTGALLYKDDLQSLAKFSSPTIEGLSEYRDPLPQNDEIIAIGFQGFRNISPKLTTDNDQLNDAVSNLSDQETLSNNEAILIQKRISDINDHIKKFADDKPNVFLVDLKMMFNDLYQIGGEILLPNGTDRVKRGYGQGFFSMDGIYPSHTGYALITREFLTEINDSNIGISVDLDAFDQTIETLWASDPYRDLDGDGFLGGPGIVLGQTDQTIVDPTLVDFTDCDDEDATILPKKLTAASPC